MKESICLDYAGGAESQLRLLNGRTIHRCQGKPSETISRVLERRVIEALRHIVQQLKMFGLCAGSKFEVNVKDSRFDALFTSSDFALDPTDPRYKATEGAKSIQKEAVSRRGPTQALNKRSEGLSTKSQAAMKGTVQIFTFNLFCLLGPFGLQSGNRKFTVSLDDLQRLAFGATAPFLLTMGQENGWRAAVVHKHVYVQGTGASI